MLLAAGEIVAGQQGENLKRFSYDNRVFDTHTHTHLYTHTHAHTTAAWLTMTLLSSWAKPLLLMTAIIRTMLGWRMQLQLPQLMQSNRKQKMQIPLSYAATAVPTATVTTIARTFNSKLLTQNSSAGLNNHKYNNINVTTTI